MFVHLGGDETSKPTYFEVVAADRLVPSLKAAVVYALSVLSQRHPWVHRLLNYEDEVYALVTLALDGHSLLTSDGTFADSLYGLRRKPLRPASGPGADRLTRRQRLLILGAEVLLPYIRTKLDKAYRRHAAAVHGGGHGVLGLVLRRYSEGGSTEASSARSMPGPVPGQGQGARDTLLRAFVRCYPWLHAGMEGATFAYHLLYLLGASPVHHPVLQALGVTMARVSGQDLMAAERAKTARRQATLASLSAPSAAAAGAAAGVAAAAAPSRLAAGRLWLLRRLLTARWAVEDNTRGALILAVFGFKALEWWYTTAEDQVARGKALPPPPPPPPPRPSPRGVGLPADPSDCPVCRRRTTNPATIATSGYVFCYPCAFNAVMTHGSCPVTLLPASLDHVRKLYEAG